MTTDFIKDFYHTFYMEHDKEGKRDLTNTVNTFLETIPPKTMAMALVALMRANHSMLDAEELNTEYEINEIS